MIYIRVYFWNSCFIDIKLGNQKFHNVICLLYIRICIHNDNINSETHLAKISLYNLSKHSLYFSQASQHSFPEVSNVYLFANYSVEYVMHEMAICSPSWFSLQLDLNESFSSWKILRVKKIVDGTGIVGQWIVEILALLIHFLEVSE